MYRAIAEWIEQMSLSPGRAQSGSMISMSRGQKRAQRGCGLRRTEARACKYRANSGGRAVNPFLLFIKACPSIEIPVIWSNFVGLFLLFASM